MNFNDRKLKGAIANIGIILAILGSIPELINNLSRKVLILQNVIRLTRNLAPDLL
jgi:hypothetical protein